MTAVRDKLIDYNRRINWMPETIKEGRMGNFLENVIDWGISAANATGALRCPFGYARTAAMMHVVGSRKELCELATGCAGKR